MIPKLALWTILGVLLGAACGGAGGGNSDGNASGLEFGVCVSSPAACASGVWDEGHKACSQACAAPADCPPEPKSGVAKCKNGACEAERADVDCEHAGETGGTSNTGAGSSAVSTQAGEPASAGAETGGTSTSGSAGSNAAGKSGSGGSAGSGGSSATAKTGIGDPCSSDDACRSGICYRPGGSPGFCTATCSMSFDIACTGSAASGTNSSNENVYCMPFAGGGRCYPGCVNSASGCSKYAGTICTSTRDIKNYPGKVCLEAL